VLPPISDVDSQDLSPTPPRAPKRLKTFEIQCLNPSPRVPGKSQHDLALVYPICESFRRPEGERCSISFFTNLRSRARAQLRHITSTKTIDKK
jgi:hypothetical protein